jgi:ubiquinone/menaquinone biosynthesis C-methylase UbiE
MQTGIKGEGELFDDWPEQYDTWFATPIGALVKEYETELLLDMLKPRPNETILDVGCGTGIFTEKVLSFNTRVIGLDISIPMLRTALRKSANTLFSGTAGDMSRLPFADESFDRVFSMTAMEFVDDARLAIKELNRVTRPGGTVVLTTLNSLGPWAERRKQKAKEGHSLFSHMTFRSPEEMIRLAPAASTARTAIHFLKDDDPVLARQKEAQGQVEKKDTGAFVALAWNKD